MDILGDAYRTASFGISFQKGTELDCSWGCKLCCIIISGGVVMCAGRPNGRVFYDGGRVCCIGRCSEGGDLFLRQIWCLQWAPASKTNSSEKKRLKFRRKIRKWR